MASRSYESGFKKYYGHRLDNISNETTEGEIKRIYDDWAGEYEESVVVAAGGIYYKPLAESFDATVKQVLKDKPKDQIKIIDVAAGTGLIGVELQKLGYTNLHALDISQEMLNEAKKKHVYKKLICAALNDHQIPEIETGEFDGLVCGATMLTGHIRSSALGEMIRIVKIGGLICFNIRDGQLVDYQEKISELETSGKWENVSKTVIPFFKSDGMPKETMVFVYKVLDVRI